MMTYRIALVFIVFNFVLSCNTDEALIITDVEDVKVDDPDPNDPDPNDPDPNDPEDVITATDVCLYDDLGIESGKEISINCLVDLGGQTFNVPSGVTFNFDGGDIFNGTLNFESSGEIDGMLLNSNLSLEGDVKLTSEEFQFRPSRWDIIEGKTTKDIALKNNQKLEGLFYWIKELGAFTFKIDKFDAYFEVTTVTSTTTNQNFYPWLESINLPSDFNLIMTNNTHLRVYPYSQESSDNGSLLGIWEVENVTVTGGNLHGDRYEYYLTDDNEEGNRLLTIRSGKNIVIDGVSFEDSSIYAVAVNSGGFSFNDNYDPSETITIKNSTFLNNRGMSIALTDGRDIAIENNSFTDSGQPSTYSDGGAVGYSIDIEPVRTRDNNGDLVEYQKVFDVLIKGNVETNSREGFLILFTGQNIIVEDNTVNTRISWSLMSGVRVRNNTFDASNSWASDSWAFSAGGTGETVFDNEFSGNTITGYNIGLNVGSVDVDIFDNTITDVSTGIQVNKAYNAKIYENTIEAENRGFYIGNTYSDGVEITGNIVTAGINPVHIAAVNEDSEYENYTILIDDNKFSGDGYVSFLRANGFTLSNNEINSGINIAGDVSNTVIESNIVNPNKTHGINIYDNHDNVIVSNNTIYEPTGSDSSKCLNNESATPSEIEYVNNSCN